MTNATQTRKARTSVKSDTPVITDVPAQSDVPDLEVITDNSDNTDDPDNLVISFVPGISDEVAQIIAFAANWDASDKSGATAQLITNYRASVGTEAFASFARAVTVEAANRTFGATVAGGMFPRIDDKPGAKDETIGKGQVSNLSGSVVLFQKCGFDVLSVPLVWARISGTAGWRDKRNTPECAEMVKAVSAATDESDKVRILLEWAVPDKKRKEVDTLAELVKAAQTLANLAEAYGRVKPGESRDSLDTLLAQTRKSLAIPAVIGVTRKA